MGSSSESPWDMACKTRTGRARRALVVDVHVHVRAGRYCVRSCAAVAQKKSHDATVLLLFCLQLKLFYSVTFRGDDSDFSEVRACVRVRSSKQATSQRTLLCAVATTTDRSHSHAPAVCVFSPHAVTRATVTSHGTSATLTADSDDDFSRLFSDDVRGETKTKKTEWTRSYEAAVGSETPVARARTS